MQRSHELSVAPAGHNYMYLKSKKLLICIFIDIYMYILFILISFIILSIISVCLHLELDASLLGKFSINSGNFQLIQNITTLNTHIRYFIYFTIIKIIIIRNTIRCFFNLVYSSSNTISLNNKFFEIIMFRHEHCITVQVI